MSLKIPPYLQTTLFTQGETYICSSFSSRNSRECEKPTKIPPSDEMPPFTGACTYMCFMYSKSPHSENKSRKNNPKLCDHVREINASSTALNLLFCPCSPALPFQASSSTCATTQHACSEYETFNVSFKLPPSLK